MREPQELLEVGGAKLDLPMSAEEICSESGLTIRREPEWCDVQIADGFVDTFSIIGRSIFMSCPRGVATPSGIEEALRFAHRIIEGSFPDGRPFVWIADYSRMVSVTRAMRLSFVDSVKNWQGLRAVIMIGLPPPLKMAAKLAKLVNLVGYDVHVVDGYREAIMIATTSYPSEDVDISADLSELRGTEVQSSPDWLLELDDFSIKLEIIDGDILHSSVSGRLESHHIDRVLEHNEHVIRAGRLIGSRYSILVNLEELDSIGYRTRRDYITKMSERHGDRPFSCLVFYGANVLVRAAFNLSRHFARFEVRMFRDLPTALRWTRESRESSQARLADYALDQHRLASIEGRHVDDLLKALGAVSWQEGAIGGLTEVDEDHPFRDVLDAINLVKGELDTVLRDRELEQKEIRKLEANVARLKKMEALGLLAGGVAHDLNNVLSGIVGYPDLLLLNPSLDEDAQESVKAIKRSGRRAAAIVDDLISIARGVASARVPVSLNSIVESYMKSPEFEELRRHHPAVEIRTELDAQLSAVDASPFHIQKVAMNLVSNAVEALGSEGEGRVTVTTMNQHVAGSDSRHEGAPDGDYVVLAVGDTGPGIRGEDIERIFEPFYSKKVMGRSGTGLGLTVVWNTAHDHQGFVEVSSSDSGSCFEVWLPITHKEVEVAHPGPTLEQVCGNGEFVVVIDDVEEQRTITCELLTKLGYRAQAVAGGAEAIELLEGVSCDLLVLDMIMEPGMNGRETYEKIKRVRPEQKAILASGFAETDEVDRAQELGAGALLRKPYSLIQLGVAVRAELGRTVPSKQRPDQEYDQE